eukprot:157233_1
MWRFLDETKPAEIEPKNSIKEEICITSKYKTKMLLHGYIRFHWNKIIPSDITSIIFSMFPLDSFYWSIQTKEIKKSMENIKSKHLAQNSWNFGFQNSTDNIILHSEMYVYDNIKFQIILKRQTINSTLINFGMKLFEQTQIMNTNKKHLINVILKIQIYCRQTNMNVINTFYTAQGSGEFELVKPIYNAFIDINDLQKYSSLDVYGTLNILHMEILDEKNSKLNIYHQNISMKKNIKYKWQLNSDIIPSYKSQNASQFGPCFGRPGLNWSLNANATNNNINCYHSPMFENNNWCFIFKHNINKNTFGVALKLLYLPVNIHAIYIKWSCNIYWNGRLFEQKQIFSDMMQLNYQSIALFENSNKYEIFGEKSIDIVVDIEILKARVNQNTGINTSNGLISKENLYLFGFTDNIKTKYDEYECDKLLLQHEIYGVNDFCREIANVNW